MGFLRRLYLAQLDIPRKLSVGTCMIGREIFLLFSELSEGSLSASSNGLVALGQVTARASLVVADFKSLWRVKMDMD